MTPDSAKALAMYERGMLTHHGLASRLVEDTTEYPTAEFVAQVPNDVLEVIHSQASLPTDTEWFAITDCCTEDLEAWGKAKRGTEQRWLAGLAWWRMYFGFTAADT